MGFSIGALNSIRHEASTEYQDRIPVATQDNIQEIGNALKTYTPLYNEFCEALVNKIGKTILETKLFENRLAKFKQGVILDQKDVEEIFMDIAKAEGAYDPTGPNPLGRREGPDVKVIYHRQNRQDVYAMSIGDIDFLRVFRSEATLDAFITERINRIFSGANHDEWLAMKKLLTSYKDYAVAEVHNLHHLGETEANREVMAKNIVKTVRKLALDMSFPSTKYNAEGVLTYTDPKDLVLLVNKDALTEIDVEVLSKAYNMGKTDIQIDVIPMDNIDLDVAPPDSIGPYEGVIGILMDKDFIRVYDTLSHFETQRNAHGLFTNYFYHVHQILSLSRFKNAVVITENGAG